MQAFNRKWWYFLRIYKYGTVTYQTIPIQLLQFVKECISYKRLPSLHLLMTFSIQTTLKPANSSPSPRHPQTIDLAPQLVQHHITKILFRKVLKPIFCFTTVRHLIQPWVDVIQLLRGEPWCGCCHGQKCLVLHNGLLALSEGWNVRDVCICNPTCP